MTENLATLQAQLAKLDRDIAIQKALDKLAAMKVNHRTMHKRIVLENELRNIK